jgi:hypothetical protein
MGLEMAFGFNNRLFDSQPEDALALAEKGCNGTDNIPSNRLGHIQRRRRAVCRSSSHITSLAAICCFQLGNVSPWHLPPDES